MERECLDILLRGAQSVILCPARRITGLRIGPEARRALQEGRLLVITCFGPDARRTTASRGALRNEFVAALANVLFIPHASPGGKTENLARRIIERRQSLFTLCDPANANLIDMGATPITQDDLHLLTSAGD